MKTITLALIIFIILISCGAVLYFTAPEDKCFKVTCPEGQQCNSTNGKCESPTNMMDKTGQAFTIPKDKCSNITCLEGQQCNSTTGKCESALNSMDRIEQAIVDKLKYNDSSSADK